jgi:hypothetical protein
LGVLGALAGLAVLVLGAASSLIPVGVLGFLLMLAGTFTVVRSMRSQPGAPVAGPATPQVPQTPGFMDRMDERFRRRRDGDDLDS